MRVLFDPRLVEMLSWEEGIAGALVKDTRLAHDTRQAT